MAQFIIVIFLLCSSILYRSLMKSEAVVFSSSAHHLCHPDDVLSLLRFKKDLIDINEASASIDCGLYSYPKMMKWNNTSSDCCTWDGVTCHQITGRVIGLDLSSSRLSGVIYRNSTLFHLSYLEKLNLSCNNFYESEISPNIGALSSLTHLNFSRSSFVGTIPSELSYLSKLVLLDLSEDDVAFNPGDFQILLRNLTHIRVLSLSGVQIPTSSHANWSSSLTYLDLAKTGIDGKLSNSIFLLRQLQTLKLNENENLSVGLLYGIPDSICSFASLKYLDISYCGFSGSFTNSIGNLSQIVQLYLFKNNFTGDILMTILNLPKLRVLDLGYNSFSGQFPSYIGNLTELTWLDLEHNLLRGPLPSNMSGLQKLNSLYLSHNEFDGTIPSWVFSVPSLRLLSLGGNQLEGQIKEFISKSLEEIDFGGNKLDGPIPYSISQLVNLESLNFSGNHLDGPIPDLTSQFVIMQSLDFSGNQLDGPIPDSISKLVNLESLDFSGNQLDGRIPYSISQLVNLESLDLSGNQLDGPIPYSIFHLVNLESLDLSGNKLDGLIPNSIFHLVNLKSLHFGSNQLDGPIPHSISQLVNLESLDLSGNKLDGPIPNSIFQLVDLSSLYLQSNNLSGSIKFTMFSHLNNLKDLDLSNNKLSLKIENKINVFFPYFFTLKLSSCGIKKFPDFSKNSNNLEDLDLSNNKLHGQIPNWIPRGLQFLNLSHNSLSSLGSFNTLISMKNLKLLDLGSNQFQEPLPLSICSFVQLYILDLSNNNFSGSVPECFGNFSPRLQVMNLAKNDLKGALSMTFPKDGCQLRNLNLNGNSVEGPLPRSLANCNSLEILDFENNKINDTFPAFLDNLVELQVLIIKSNRFFGSISNSKNENFLPSLLVFDLSCNEFTGALPPELFRSFKAMATLGKTEPRASYFRSSGYLYHYSMTFVTEGNILELVEILTTFVVIDLSSNNFTGDIPEIIGNLNSLTALNLSHNNFSGHMPSALGKLYFLESLDLSWNQIEGEIPWQLADITNLEFLNVSKNRLRGRIPQGKQFNTFLNDSYYGNFELCGFPVTKKCGEIYLPLPPSGGSYQDDEDSSFRSTFTWKSVIIGYGFGVAVGCLVLFTGKPNWLARHIEKVCWCALLLLGKLKEMCKKLMKKSRRKHYRRNIEHSDVPYFATFSSQLYSLEHRK